VTVAGVLGGGALDAIRSVTGVESAESSTERFKHVVAAFQALRILSQLLVIGLASALLIGLIQLTKMNAFLHRDVASLLRLWGGGVWASRGPTLLSSLSVGLAGGAVALGIWAGLS